MTGGLGRRHDHEQVVGGQGDPAGRIGDGARAVERGEVTRGHLELTLELDEIAQPGVARGDPPTDPV